MVLTQFKKLAFQIQKTWIWCQTQTRKTRVQTANEEQIIHMWNSSSLKPKVEDTMKNRGRRQRKKDDLLFQRRSEEDEDNLDLWRRIEKDNLAGEEEDDQAGEEQDDLAG